VTETTSVSSSAFSYQYENGRSYHAYRAGQYLLPNDDIEQERLDMTHHVFSLTLNGDLCMTKLGNPKRILDLGTGTGIWVCNCITHDQPWSATDLTPRQAIDIGDAFPSAEVIGTDLSPIQSQWYFSRLPTRPFIPTVPRTLSLETDQQVKIPRVPPNVRFEIDDATLPWTFPPSHFSFIHARTLAGAIQDWPSLVGSIHTHLESNGRVEISEGRANFWCDDGSLPSDSATAKWLAEFRRLSEPLGFDISPKLPDLLKQAGFVDVEMTQRVVPLGSWPRDRQLKEIGKFFRVQFLEFAIEAYTLALFTRAGGWKAEEVQVLLGKVRRELRGNGIHLYTFT